MLKSHSGVFDDLRADRKSFYAKAGGLSISPLVEYYWRQHVEEAATNLGWTKRGKGKKKKSSKKSTKKKSVRKIATKRKKTVKKTNGDGDRPVEVGCEACENCGKNQPMNQADAEMNGIDWEEFINSQGIKACLACVVYLVYSSG